MFTYGDKKSADGIQKTWERSVQHIGIFFVQDIITELQTRIIMVIPEPFDSQEILYRNWRKFQLCNRAYARLIEFRNKVLESLAVDAAINNLNDVLKTE